MSTIMKRGSVRKGKTRVVIGEGEKRYAVYFHNRREVPCFHTFDIYFIDENKVEILLVEQYGKYGTYPLAEKGALATVDSFIENEVTTRRRWLAMMILFRHKRSVARGIHMKNENR